MTIEKRELYPYQHEALVHCMNNENVALFMEMRLGKTLVTIRALQYHGNVLVVAPLSVLGTWQNELAAEGIPNVCTLRGPVEGREAHVCELFRFRTAPCWVLTNYETLRLAPGITKLPWYAVVFDESSKLRNVRTKTSKICLSEFKRTKRRFILTGLPAPESPLDYWGQMAFLDGEFMKHRSYWTFRDRLFMQPTGRTYGWFPRKGVRDQIRDAVNERAFVLSRKNAGIGNKRVYETRMVEPSQEQERLFTEIKAHWEATLGEEKLSTKWAMVAASWVNQVSGGFLHKQKVGDGKLQELVELLKGELADQQVVVWFRFNAELESTHALLQERSIKSCTVLGETKPELRYKYVNEFNAGKVRVLLVQLKCGKFGLNLSSSSTAIYFSNGFSHEDRAQSEDRIEHTEKNEPLLFIDLVTRGSSDQRILNLLNQKVKQSRYFYNEVLS